MMQYPSDMGVLYAEGYSVVKYLIELNGRPNLLKFVLVGMKDGWDVATKRFYDFDSVDALETAWIESLRIKQEQLIPPVDTKLKPQPPVQSNAPLAVDLTQATNQPQVVPPVMGPVMPPTADVAPPRVDGESSQGPSILVVRAAMMNGKITCKFPKEYTEESITSYLLVGDKYEPVTSYKTKIMEEVRSYHFKALEVLGADGKPLSEKEAAKRLAKETPVLFLGNYSIDPQILAMLKPDSLIIYDRMARTPPARVEPPALSVTK
jgi:hypothetical protein